MTTNHADQAPAADPETNAPRSSTREQALEAALRDCMLELEAMRENTRPFVEPSAIPIDRARAALALPASQPAPVVQARGFSFDGHGINDADKYARRLATFTDYAKEDGTAARLGPMFAAAPDMLAALHTICQPGNLGDMQGDLMALGRAAIARATGKA